MDKHMQVYTEKGIALTNAAQYWRQEMEFSERLIKQKGYPSTLRQFADVQIQLRNVF